MHAQKSIRIAAWNVNSIKVRLPHVIQWLESQAKAQNPIDALCLQELKLTDDKYPHRELEGTPLQPSRHLPEKIMAQFVPHQMPHEQ